MVVNNSRSSSANGSNGSNGSGGQRPAAAAKRAPPSTWTVFLFHFALPMALVAILSNINDIYNGLVSFPSHLLHHAWNAKTMQPELSTESSVKKPTLSPKERPTAAAINNQQQPQTQTTVKTTTTTTTRPTVATTKSSTTTTTRSSKTSSSTSSSNHPRHRQNAASDPFHQQMETNIRTLRQQYKQAVNTPNEHLAAIQLADFLKYRDTVIHDGGTYQMEAIEVYSRALSLLEDKWRKMMTNGEDTRKTAMTHDNEQHSGNEENDYYSTGLNHELFLDYGSKSIEGLLCATYTNLGKTYFMSNMFERAVQSHNQCLSYDHRYIDALSSRGQAYIILGKYKEAATDFFQVLYMDSNRLFGNVVTGLARCLSADDSVIDGGWESLVQLLEADIPRQVESLQRAKELSDDSAAATIKHYADILKHMHHAMFQYHDIKTKNVSEAWKHLSKGNEYKMSTLAPFDEAFEIDKVSRLKNVFTPGFWPAGMGSDTKTPIFIIGFVRSGSTLLERILDAHPLIVGTGEDSVFNGRLDSIRNDIIKASMAGQGEFLQTVKKLADDVVVDMIKRWEIIDANTNSEDSSSERAQNPTRFVDKMLSNYMNVGFIHLLFPNALILHVAREPMDSIFSAFKHDFPPGGFDYTSEFSSLARLYHGYRDVMEHWDKVLPGRVTHIRYEDLVKDLPGMAPKILSRIGVPWDPAVLEFHQKKHAVNTLSTTQVRKGVYSHHLKGWKRYEEFLEPLLKRIGSRVEFKLSTSLTPSSS
eukprot:scaffold9834_cov131-Skeletonema_dohrnii-CCMP3373.AAC.8